MSTRRLLTSLSVFGLFCGPVFAQELSVQSGNGQGYVEINRAKPATGEIPKASEFEELEPEQPVVNLDVLAPEPEPEPPKAVEKKQPRA